MPVSAPPSFPLSQTKGRVRLHCPTWVGGSRQALERHLLELDGVRSVQANAATRNVLVFYDEARVTVARLAKATTTLARRLRDKPQDAPTLARPSVLVHKTGSLKRARITVRGLDRDPQLGARIIEHLQHRRPGVRALANPITSRVMVEFPEHLHLLEEIIAEVTHFELPGLPEEDLIHHPLDTGPVIQGTVRVVGAALGLGMIAVRRLMRADQPLIPAAGPARIAGLLGLAQGFPIVRVWLRRMLGRTAADFMLFGPIVVSLALSESVLGLALTGIESIRLLSEVMARRAAWERYENRLADAPSAHPGAVIRIDSGQRVPLKARIIEGTGTGTGRDGLPLDLEPDATVSAGARLFGGPFVVELLGHRSFDILPRPAAPKATVLDRYVQNVGLASLAYAAGRGIYLRSWGSVLEGMMLVNPRTAVIGSDFGDISAFSRMLRGNIIVVGTRHRSIPLPDTILLDNPRVLTHGFELARVVTVKDGPPESQLLAAAAAVSLAAGAPWGAVFGSVTPQGAGEGSFDGRVAQAQVEGIEWRLAPPTALSHRFSKPLARAMAKAKSEGSHPLVLMRGDEATGLLVVRPRLVDGVPDLVENCRRRGVRLALLSEGSIASTRVAERAHIELIHHHDGVAIIRELQAQGQRVAYVADDAEAGAEFAHCDLAIGLSAGQGSHFPARADLLAPDIGAVSLILEASARQRVASRDAVILSCISNVVGAAWGLSGEPGIERASLGVYITALISAGIGWARLHGGERPLSIVAQLADPRPERWGGRSIDSVLQVLQSSPQGLTSLQAAERRRTHTGPKRPNQVLQAVLKQFKSPLPAVLAVAAGVALTLGATLDFVVIVATIGLNLVVGTWQEVQTDRAAEALQEIGSPSAKVLRDGHPIVITAPEIVPGDILVLGSGDRIAADARVLEAHGLEVDEAALTGESHPVAKLAEYGTHSNHVVLEGSDVVVGTGRAIVIAVGRQTRLGATAAALALHDDQDSPLGKRMAELLRQLMPVVLGGGVVVVASGLLRQQSIYASLAIGASIALASVPEGLPLLAGIGEAAVARRLARRGALVRRLTAVEALGRVDVACTDKTGTLTTGKLALRVVASSSREFALPGRLDGLARHILLTAALACPHPDATDVAAHPTDLAVLLAAREAGLYPELRIEREDSAPFDPTRSYHGVRVHGKLWLKGAPEALAPLCTWRQDETGLHPLRQAGRKALLQRADELAAQGLRVLMVATGPAEADVDDPQELTALGFVGLSDPLRPHVRQAVERCLNAGIRVIMLTGDHATTARVIATEAGLAVGPDTILSGNELADLTDADLDHRLHNATVIARATPLDKLRIIESLRRGGHTIAMTGDGVNDAPALRLADVGVAMGKTGTEVARQAADVVLLDDDFAHLVDALVEGRSFWRNMRRALGLLLGGNLGELGLVVGASLAGTASPLTTAQILAVNLLTDGLPALSVVLQGPEHRNLAVLSREGLGALNHTIRRDVIRRGISTSVPSLAAFLWTVARGESINQARSVAFASVVATQLAQTLDAGMAEGGLTPPVMKAVALSSAVLVGAFTVPVLQQTFALALPGPWGLAVVAGGAAVSVLLNRTLARVQPPTALVPVVSRSQPSRRRRAPAVRLRPAGPG